MIKGQPINKGPLLRRDLVDAKPAGVRVGNPRTTDCDPTSDCAESCSSCESSSAASCGGVKPISRFSEANQYQTSKT